MFVCFSKTFFLQDFFFAKKKHQQQLPPPKSPGRPPETIAKTLALAAQERSMDPSAKVGGFPAVLGSLDEQ